MERWYRMLLILLAFGIAASSRQDDSIVGEESDTFDAEKEPDETVVTTATERYEAATSSDSEEASTSDGEEQTERGDGERDNPEEHLTTIFEAAVGDEVEEETTAVPQREEERAAPTTVTSTTSTTLPSVRTYGRMVRFGTNRRMSRPTTVEPPRRSTANSRALLNRRGLFNPELRNRYLARFRSSTPEPNT